MRAHRLAPLLLFALPLGCQGEEPGGVEASVTRVTLDVSPGSPDANANLDASVELQARGQPEEVTLVEARITAQPVSESSNSLVFDADMRNTMGDDPVVRLAKGETVPARILNVGTTNAELEPWCGLPAEFSVTVETADGEEASATANLTIACP